MNEIIIILQNKKTNSYLEGITEVNIFNIPLFRKGG